MLVFFLLVFICPVFSQEPVPLRKETELQKMPSIKYRPGIPYKNVPLQQDSGANLIPSAAVTVERPNVGRMGSVRIDGTGTKPTLAVDGFAVMDVSINEGQTLIDMVPLEFAVSADIYQQNLV
ncbi:MAG: hypothetical protein ACRCY4_03745, partial [Brevinema sp.]